MAQSRILQILTVQEQLMKPLIAAPKATTLTPIPEGHWQQHADEDIIDAEFTEVFEPRGVNPLLASEFYKYIGNIGQGPKPGSVVSTYC